MEGRGPFEVKLVFWHDLNLKNLYLVSTMCMHADILT